MAGGVLRNKYWVLRHGRSIPNEKGLIVSSPANGVLPEYGLAAEGILQAKEAGELFLKEIQTEGLPLEKVMEELRERYFGPPLELRSHNHYPEIWDLDERDPFKPPEGGESVADVASRLSVIVSMIESECEGYAILLVSHGDPLQIFQAILRAAVQTHSEKDGLLQGNLDSIMTASNLSQHRKFALATESLRAESHRSMLQKWDWQYNFQDKFGARGIQKS